MIRGERVYLTELDRGNMETARAWLNDPDINRFLDTGQIPITRSAEESFYDAMAVSHTDFVFEIHASPDGRYLGNTGLHAVDWRHRHAHLGIFLGYREDHGKGYAADALRALMGFAFDTLGLHRVVLTCYEGNDRAMQLYRHVGFTEVGRAPEAYYRDGRYWDEFTFQLLDRDFRSQAAME